MTEPLSPAEARQRVEDAVIGSRKQIPEMSNILDAFQALLMERAALKAELRDNERIDLPSVDQEKFRSGVPLANKNDFRESAEKLNISASHLVPAMKSGFPKAAAEFSKMEAMVRERTVNVEGLLVSLLQDKSGEVDEAAERIEVDGSLLRFFLNQLIKPFVENRAIALSGLVEKTDWNKGYCPICGSWPEITYIEGKEGRRWLKCSFCSHEWRFPRTTCPFCETSNTDELEVYFSEDREFERAELCHDCKRYIVGIDFRDRTEEPVLEVLTLRLFYLDILAQEKGFQPGALPSPILT